MIRQSFIFLEKVSQKTEDYLHSIGINNWDDFLKTNKVFGFSDQRKLHYDRKILETQSHLYNFNSRHFSKILPSTETWRLYNFFKDDAVFLDIETSGLDRSSYITMVGLFDGIETKAYIRGMNLDQNSLKEELKKYKLIVTFNGSTFDLPMINNKFPNILPDIPHIDLRHACARIGLRGGLKSIERELGIKRSNPIIEQMYGGDAITMWRMYKATGDEYYLRLLIEYNEEDCINLKSIANKVYDKLAEKTSSPQTGKAL